MPTRIGTGHGSNVELPHWIGRSREHVKRDIARDPTQNAAYWLVDRAPGTGLMATTDCDEAVHGVST